MSALKNRLSAEVTSYESSISAGHASGASDVTPNDALADALSRILTGRTLAEHLGFDAPMLRPVSDEESIAWILAGRGANLVH